MLNYTFIILLLYIYKKENCMKNWLFVNILLYYSISEKLYYIILFKFYSIDIDLVT